MARLANYARPIQLSLQVLSEAGIDSYPVSLKQILRHNGIRLWSYEDFCLANGCSMQECFGLFGKDGATIENNGRYLIVYNRHATPKDRIRFTLAHELGHIFHQHHRELGVEILQRLRVEKTLYDVLEDEANCFARNLLCPAISVQTVLRDHGFVFSEYDQRQERNVWRKVPTAKCLPDLPQNLTDSFLVRQSFMVTEAAAKARCSFLKQDLRNTVMSTASSLLARMRFNAQWRCRQCGAVKQAGWKYCYHCGSKNRFSLIVKESPSLQPVFLRYTGHRFSSCPVCGNEEMPKDAKYCPICGNAVSNPCVPWRVRNTGINHLLDLSEHGSVHLNPPGARYCLTCGSPTIYGEVSIADVSDLFDDKPDPTGTIGRASLYYYLLSRGINPETDNQGGLPSMKYGPNIPVTKQNGEYKVKKCPVCLNENIESDADYCIMCGTSLTNICDGVYDDYNNELIQHSNPANARFCHCCGKPTAYSRLAILPSYKEALRRFSEKEAISRELAEMDIDDDLFWEMQGEETPEEAPSPSTQAAPPELPFILDDNSDDVPF